MRNTRISLWSQGRFHNFYAVGTPLGTNPDDREKILSFPFRLVLCPTPSLKKNVFIYIMTMWKILPHIVFDSFKFIFHAYVISSVMWCIQECLWFSFGMLVYNNHNQPCPGELKFLTRFRNLSSNFFSGNIPNEVGLIFNLDKLWVLFNLLRTLSTLKHFIISTNTLLPGNVFNRSFV